MAAWIGGARDIPLQPSLYYPGRLRHPSRPLSPTSRDLFVNLVVFSLGALLPSLCPAYIPPGSLALWPCGVGPYILKVWLSLSFCPLQALQADLWVRTQRWHTGRHPFDGRLPGGGPCPGQAACSLCLLVIPPVCYPHSEAGLGCLHIHLNIGRGKVDGGDILLLSVPFPFYAKPTAGRGRGAWGGGGRVAWGRGVLWQAVGRCWW